MGCASVRRQTPSMEKYPEVQVTKGELRVRVYNYQNHFAAVVQSAADAIIENERGLGIQEAAIRWKVNAIPAVEKAVFQTDPLAALGDAWGVTVAMARYLDEGEGRALFGASQSLAVEAAHRLESDIEQLAETVAGAPRAERARQRIERWIRANPIRDLTFGRRSGMMDLSITTAAELGVSGLQAVGEIETTARDLSERLTVYFERLPKQIRWNAELVVIEVMREFGGQVFSDIGSIEESARGVRSFLDATPDLVRSEREAIIQAMNRELENTLESVDRQRVATLGTLQGERSIILETLQSELQWGLEAVRQERVAALADLEALSQQMIETSTRNVESAAQRIVDRLFWRALFLLLLAAIALGLVAWIAARAMARGV
jgi:hypothetical protein